MKNKKAGEILLILLAVAAVIGGGWGINNAAYDRGYEEGLQSGTTLTLTPLYPTVPEYEPPMTEEEQILLLLDKFSEGVETANITIKFDSDGKTTGSIHIFYNTKRD